MTPGASREEVKIADDGSVQLRVAARPIDGAANEAVLRLLAAALACPRRNLALLRGDGARIKLIGVALDS